MPSLLHLLPATAAYGYLLLFALATIEGPIVTVLGGLLASIGTLDFFWVYVVVVAADLAGDAIHYAVGRWGVAACLKSWGRHRGAATPRLRRLEHRFAARGWQTLVIGKLTHSLGGAVLVAAGVARMPILDFLLYNLLPTLPKSLLFLSLGYYFGRFYSRMPEYILYAFFPLLLLGGFLLYRSCPFRKEQGQPEL